MGAYFNRLTGVAMTLVVLAIMANAPAHATWAEIKLIKKVAGGTTEKFDFTISGAESAFRVYENWTDTAYPTVTLKPTSGMATSRWYYIEAGTNTIAENLPTGFSLDSVSCEREGGDVKEWDGHEWVWKSVDAGAVSLTVVKSAGTFKFHSYYLDKITCTITNVTDKPEPPTLIIEKISKGGTGTFKFSGSGTAGTFSDRMVTTDEVDKAKAIKEKITLKAGDLTITEAETPNFTLVGAECKVGSTFLNVARDDHLRTVEITMPATGEVVCTITNEYVAPPPPTLIIKKLSKDGFGKFTFSLTGAAAKTASGGTIPDVPIETDHADVYKPSEKITLKPGGLTITEAESGTFSLVSAKCTFGTTEYVPTPAAPRSITLVIPATGTTVCEFVNQYSPPPTLIIKKISKGRTGKFTFALKGTATGNGANGTLPDVPIETKEIGVAEASNKITLTSGTLTITEAESSTFPLVSAECISPTTVYRSTRAKPRSVTVVVPATGDIVCTFTNKYVKPPTIVVRKITKGGVGTFTFSGDGPAGSFKDVPITTVVAGEAAEAEITVPLKAGQLTITEAEVDGYRLIAASCQVDKKDRRVLVNKRRRFIKVTVPKTGQLVCTFVNRKGGGTITIISNFLKRRAEWLTGDTGRPRLIERRQDRYARSSLKDGWGINGQGTEREGRIGYRTSLSKLGGSLRESTFDKAARLGVDASQYGRWDEPAYRGGWDIWSEGSWSYVKSDGGSAGGTASSGQFGLVRGGVDYLVNPGLLVGVLIQYDYLRESAKADAAAQASGEGGFEISGHGWMAGPYVEYELTKNLFFDAKGLIGTSLNEVSPYRTFSDEFTTTRWLLAARLTGSWQWRDSERSYWHFSPRAEVVWFNEESEDFVDSEGYLVAGQRVHLGRFKAGPELSYRYMTRAGTIFEPRVAAQALWSFSRSGNAKGGGLDPATISSVKDVPLETFQMRFEAGLKIEDEHGQRLEIEANYTGLGKQGHQAIGGKVGVTIPLQAQQQER